MSQPQPQFPAGGNTFKVLKEPISPTVDDYERQLRELTEKVTNARESEQQRQAILMAQERDAKFKKLDALKENLGKLNEAVGLAGKLSIHDAMELGEEKRKLVQEIEELEIQLGFQPVDTHAGEVNLNLQKLSTVPTVLKVVGLVMACLVIVLFSGTWILNKYPNAAIYNEVSFQKVLFGFAVFICAIGAVITALSVFFPGMAKYFNPFNTQKLDFYSDFKQLSEWQRTVISLALFSLLLLAFVLTVSGKLD